MNKLPSILPIGLLVTLGLLAFGFRYLAVHAYDAGTQREYIPQLKASAAREKCVRQR